MLGFKAFIYAHTMEVCDIMENVTIGRCYINVFLIPFCLLWYGVTLVAMTYMIALILIQNIEEKFKCKNPSNKIAWAEECICLYNQLEQSMGPYSSSVIY